MYCLAVCGLVLLMVYIILIPCIYGLQEFVSDDYYITKNKWLFSVAMVIFPLAMLPYMIETYETLGFLALFMVFGLALVGLEPHYKSAHGKTIHNSGAYTALACGSIWALAVNPLPYICTIAFTSILLLFVKKWRKYYYFFIETTAILGVGLSVLTT